MGSNAERFRYNPNEGIRTSVLEILGRDTRTPAFTIPLQLDYPISKWRIQSDSLFQRTVWDVTSPIPLPVTASIQPNSHNLYVARGVLDVDSAQGLKLRVETPSDKQIFYFGTVDDPETLKTLQTVEGFDIGVAMTIDARQGNGEYRASLYPEIFVRPTKEQLLARFESMRLSSTNHVVTEAHISSIMDKLTSNKELTAENIVHLISIFEQLRKDSSL